MFPRDVTNYFLEMLKHYLAINKVREWFDAHGWISYDVIESPIKGTKGNTEYFIHCKKL